MDDERDPIDRLRAADPAADVEPRDGFAAEIVAAVAQDDDAAIDLAAERARRRRRGVAATAIAASIAAALVIGGGIGFGIAERGPQTTAAETPDDEQVEGAEPPVALDGGSGELSDLGSGERLQGGAEPLLSVADSMWAGRNDFHANVLLSRAPRTATAYAYDAPSASNTETVAALAAALGVEGTPELRDGMWSIPAPEADGRSLWVSVDGTMWFSYYDATIDPWQCGEGCTPPDEHAAIDALRALLTDLGRDAETFEYESETFDGPATRTAYAWPLRDGRRVDQRWVLELAASGVASASGPLAEPVSLGEYEVVGEQEAFERLSDPRFGAQMTAMPYALREETTAEWTPPTAPPSTPTAGTAIDWPVTDVEIVSANLGLASTWMADGSVVLAPAYEFTDAGGGTWSVIAVAESSLDFSVG